MNVLKITDPAPVWNAIRTQMSDDSGKTVCDGDFLGVFDDEKMAGAFLVKPWTTFCCEIHGGVHPDYWGKGPEVCWNIGNTIFDHSAILKIVAIIPAYNRLMINCVTKIGMKQEGIIERAWVKGMKLHDLVLFGITKSERGPLCQPKQR